MLQAPAVGRPPSVVIHTASADSLGSRIGWTGSAHAAGTTTANLAFYVPFVVDEPFVARKMWIINGATAAGNVDVGIYSSAGTRLVSSGATAQSGTSAIQAFDITDTTLARGSYYMAVSLSDGTATLVRWATAVERFALLGVMQEASAHPLPATATMVAASTARIPLIGVSRREVLA